MKAEVARRLAQDAAAAAARRTAAAALMQEVAHANDAMLARKREAKVKEKEADAAIVAYVTERDAREQVRCGCWHAEEYVRFGHILTGNSVSTQLRRPVQWFRKYGVI